MKDRKTETFVYEGLGIPVKLINVPMRKMVGEWVIDIDLEDLQRAVLYRLLYKAAPLNGDELRFIRKFLQMTTTEFGKIFGVSHVAIVKWESGKTHAQLPMDVYIRLYVLDCLKAKDKEFRSLYHEISPQRLSRSKGEKERPISVDTFEELKSA